MGGDDGTMCGSKNMDRGRSKNTSRGRRDMMFPNPAT
jgi:hypothetical protein